MKQAKKTVSIFFLKIILIIIALLIVIKTVFPDPVSNSLKAESTDHTQISPVYYIEEFDPTTSNLVKKTFYQKDGQTNDIIFEYDKTTGKIIKQTNYNQNKTINYIFEYDTNQNFLAWRPPNEEEIAATTSTSVPFQNTYNLSASEFNPYLHVHRVDQIQYHHSSLYQDFQNNVSQATNYYDYINNWKNNAEIKPQNYTYETLDQIAQKKPTITFYDINGQEHHLTYYHQQSFLARWNSSSYYALNNDLKFYPQNLLSSIISNSSQIINQYLSTKPPPACPSNMKIVYNSQNGNKQSLTEFNQNSKPTKITQYQSDGQTNDIIFEYDKTTGKIIKQTNYNQNKTINYIFEYDTNQNFLAWCPPNEEEIAATTSTSVPFQNTYNLSASEFNPYLHVHRVDQIQYHHSSLYQDFQNNVSQATNYYDYINNWKNNAEIKPQNYTYETLDQIAQKKPTITFYDINGQEHHLTYYHQQSFLARWNSSSYYALNNDLKFYPQNLLSSIISNSSQIINQYLSTKPPPACPSNMKIVYNSQNGNKQSLTEFNQNSKPTKITQYQSDGKTIDTIFHYNDAGQKIKETKYRDNGKTIFSITEYNPETDQRLKKTVYQSDGITIDYTIDYTSLPPDD
ncbi:DUF2963 domain-containing protein [Candidatus Phytoplasma solani]